jgi:hypothetical protein
VQLGDDSPANTDRRARVDRIEAEITANRAAREQAELDIAGHQQDIRALLQ